MPSPFPGMDPYLEGYLWPDVHHRLATQISDQLMPLVWPRYVARIEIQVVSDDAPEAEIGIMYPACRGCPNPPETTATVIRVSESGDAQRGFYRDYTHLVVCAPTGSGGTAGHR